MKLFAVLCAGWLVMFSLPLSHPIPLTAIAAFSASGFIYSVLSVLERREK